MKRRGNNEGCIYEERPGRWIAQITLGYKILDGKRRRVRKKFVASTRNAVQRKLTGALREQQTGGIVPVERDTLGQHLTNWLKGLSARGRRMKTIESYTWLATKHIIPELGQIKLTRLTQRDLNDFMEQKVAAGLDGTARHCHRLIRSALSKAEKDGLVCRNVAKLAECPPAPKHSGSVRPLSPTEARDFLAAVSGHRLEALYSVALAIGLRRGEALGLEWTGLDLDRGLLSVTQTVQRIKGKGMVKERAAKRERSLRTVPLPPFAIGALRRHRENQQRERDFAGQAWKENGLVFASTIGTAIEPTNLRKHFKSVLKLLKIDSRRFHDLRHTAASLLLAQGATLHEVKEILGHSQIALTANLYGHAYTSVVQAAVDRVGSLLVPNQTAPQMAPLVKNDKPN
jgi:integrase